MGFAARDGDVSLPVTHLTLDDLRRVDQMDLENQRFCAKLRVIHREIMIEFEKIDKRREWSYSLKGVTVHYDPRAALKDKP